MAKTDNLRPISLTHEQATENGRKGGLASAEARRRRKEMRKLLNDYLDQEAVPHLKAWMRSHGIKDEDCSNLAALFLSVFCKALSGDVNAARTVLEWAGQLPLQKEQEAAKLACYQRMHGSEGTVQSLQEEDSTFRDVVIYDPKNTRTKKIT